jgi:hypothetical protein
VTWIWLADARDHFADAFFPRRSEWAGAALLCFGGWVLSTNPDLMATSQGKAFDLMKATFTQPTWAALLMYGGGLRLVVLAINGSWRKSPHLRALAAILSGFFWWQIAASYYATFGLGYSAYAVFLGLEFSNLIVAARDARTVDDKCAGKSSAGH